MHRLRPSRTHLWLGLVIVLLATVPVLIPLLFTSDNGATGPEGLQPVVSPAVPALPRGDASTATPTVAAPPQAGRLVTVRPTPSPTPSPTTAAPSTVPSTVPSTARSTAPSTVPSTVPPPPAPPAPAPATTTTAPPSPTDSPTVLAAGADLVVVSVSWTPDPTAGTPVAFAAVVRNAGTDPTPAVTHGVAFSVDGTKVTWSAGSSEPLAPGQERTYTADGGEAGTTWAATSGDHTVTVQADDLDVIPETDEADNTATAELVVP
ncbi:MAG TPA: CARDB domain-containing protein [Mycobacteriales bacterium]